MYSMLLKEAVARQDSFVRPESQRTPEFKAIKDVVHQLTTLQRCCRPITALPVLQVQATLNAVIRGRDPCATAIPDSLMAAALSVHSHSSGAYKALRRLVAPGMPAADSVRKEKQQHKADESDSDFYVRLAIMFESSTAFGKVGYLTTV